MRERTGGKVKLWPAGLYGTLKRLIEADLIEESDERPAPELDDARRRYYRLTPLGERVLAAENALAMRRMRVKDFNSVSDSASAPACHGADARSVNRSRPVGRSKCVSTRI